jgi:hypothetical protein
MSASDGTVGATVKVVDNGPEESRWDLVILGDGYRAAELPQFHEDVERFCAKVLKPTPPFDELWPAINVHRIDVSSTDSGADDPEVCGGTGARLRTFFDASFCAPPWHIDRLLTVNEPLAKQVADAGVPLRNAILVLVNTSKRGGSGPPDVATSSNAYADDIGLHELGHSAFGLADEYEGGETGGLEPREPNVTRDTNRATNKWRALVKATTPMPTSCNDGCPQCRPPAQPPPPDAVGTYEGARYQRCGAYRPFPDCYMRFIHVFCPVCAGVIRRTLEPLLP